MAYQAYQIEIQNDNAYALKTLKLEQAALTVLTQQSAPANSELTIMIADDEIVAALNRQYREIDSPTDVLSFPAGEPGIFDNEAAYLGDIVIAYPYATAQAQREGHDVDDSLALLVIHGVLHLLGFDHDTPENRASMWKAQVIALDALGISPAIVPALEGESHD